MFWIVDLLTAIALALAPKGFTRNRGTLEYISDPVVQSIEFLVADRRGLSFRDSWGHEELKVSSSVIGSIDDPRAEPTCHGVPRGVDPRGRR